MVSRRWDDSRWGRRVGYIEKRHVNALVAAPQQSVDSRVAESTPPAPRTLESAQPRSDQVAAPVVPAAAQSDRSGFTLMVDMGLGIQSDTGIEESAVGLADSIWDWAAGSLTKSPSWAASPARLQCTASAGLARRGKSRASSRRPCRFGRVRVAIWKPASDSGSGIWRATTDQGLGLIAGGSLACSIAGSTISSLVSSMRQRSPTTPSITSGSPSAINSGKTPCRNEAGTAQTCSGPFFTARSATRQPTRDMLPLAPVLHGPAWRRPSSHPVYQAPVARDLE